MCGRRRARAQRRAAGLSGQDGLSEAAYSAVQPPSRTRPRRSSSEEASEARNTIAPVNSSSWPSRPSLILASTSSRNALSLEERSRHRRLQERRAQAVDADVVGRKLDRHRLGEAFHRVLARAVDGAARCADMPHLRRDVDDRARTLGLDQPARHRLRHEEGRAHVERQDQRRNPRPSHPPGRPADWCRHCSPARRTARQSRSRARTASRSVTSSASASALSPRARIACRRRLDLSLRARSERHMRAGLRQRGRPPRARCRARRR